MSIENALSEIGKGLDRLALGIKKPHQTFDQSDEV